MIVHEFGHQFWYGLVANNEFEESWMDEGFNTYSTAKVLKTAYGADVIPFGFAGVDWFYFPIEIPHPLEDRIFTLQGEFNDPILTPAWKFYDSTSYGLNSYPRTGLTLNTLERYLGEDVMARVMREYQQKWRYRHPASQDFSTPSIRSRGRTSRGSSINSSEARARSITRSPKSKANSLRRRLAFTTKKAGRPRSKNLKRKTETGMRPTKMKSLSGAWARRGFRSRCFSL